MSAEIREQLLAMLSPAVSERGGYLEDVEIRQAGRRTLVRLLVDKDGGIDLDAVASISRAASALLDEHEADLPMDAYVLEVSSPGIDRPLTQSRHFLRNIGRLLSVTDVDGAVHQGHLVEYDDDVLTLQSPKSQMQIALVNVAKAVVEVEFNPGSGKVAALTEVEGGGVLSEYRDSDGNPGQGQRR